MKVRVLGAAVLALAALGGAASAGQPAGSGGPHAPADWAALGRLPEIDGVWEVVGGGMISGTGAPMTPAAAEKLKKYQAARAADEIQDYETANCIPPGILINMSMPYPIELLVTPGKVTMIMEAFTQARHIYTDGRPMPEDPDLSYNGTSVGRWEGDTLVVETIGFLPEVELAWGLGHGDKLKITERYRLVQPDRLEVQFTIDDPSVLTAPWVHTKTFQRRRTWGVREYVCQQNNQHLFDGDSGKAVTKLGD